MCPGSSVSASRRARMREFLFWSDFLRPSVGRSDCQLWSETSHGTSQLSDVMWIVTLPPVEVFSSTGKVCFDVRRGWITHSLFHQPKQSPPGVTSNSFCVCLPGNVQELNLERERRSRRNTCTEQFHGTVPFVNQETGDREGARGSFVTHPKLGIRRPRIPCQRTWSAWRIPPSSCARLLRPIQE